MNATKIPFYFLIASLCVLLLGHLDLDHTIFDININSGFYIGKMLFSEFYSIVLFSIAAILWSLNRLNLKVNTLFKNIHFIVTTGLVFLIFLTNAYLKLTGISDSDNLTRYVLFYGLLMFTLIMQPLYLLSFRKT